MHRIIIKHLREITSSASFGLYLKLSQVFTEIYKFFDLRGRGTLKNMGGATPKCKLKSKKKITWAIFVPKHTI